MSLKLRKESALNLTLKGSMGAFDVGKRSGGRPSTRVRYFLTHVGLDFQSAAAEAILSHIAPVREIFDFEQLEFDEIMQRDIDDARVSSELVPYLLDDSSRGLVKLFPPIIVVVLPLQRDANRPADFYPPVEEFDRREDDDDYDYRILRSGVVGQEIFQFEQPLQDGIPEGHDLVRFKLNTNRTRLIIVDGQHRAMALLALYRNLKDQWSDARRAPYREYYAEWTAAYIKRFNLSEINLPVMLCTFPDIDENYVGDFDLKKAARAIFLTLNKNARKVSESRNILLDDNDIIAEFLRECLSAIKAKDMRSPHALRIHNVELDQSKDRARLSDPISITGVGHIYYVVEHLMLHRGEDDVNGAKPRAGRFDLRSDLETYGLYRRLRGKDLIGKQGVDSTTRTAYTGEVEAKLEDAFQDKYGEFVVLAFEKFSPFEIHNRAVLRLRQELEQHKDQKLVPILFEGQGVGEVFERHRRTLREKLKTGKFEHDVPQVEAVLERLDATAKRKEAVLDEFRVWRLEGYLRQVSEKRWLKDEAGEWLELWLGFVNTMYGRVFTTVAFQAALICGFFREAEGAYGQALNGFDRRGQFEEYLTQISDFFIPKTFGQLKALVGTMDRELEVGKEGPRIIDKGTSFREVVFRGEMKPDQWPKYAYLLTELWTPSDQKLAETVEASRSKARKQVFASLHESRKVAFCKLHARLEESLTDDERRQIRDEAHRSFAAFLRKLGRQLPPVEELQEMLKSDFETANEDETDED